MLTSTDRDIFFHFTSKAAYNLYYSWPYYKTLPVFGLRVGPLDVHWLSGKDCGSSSTA